MFSRLLVCVLITAAAGGSLLALRQARLQTLHEMGQLHTQMNDLRTATWDLQVRIAEATQPHALEAALERAQLELEPVPTPRRDDQPPTGGPGVSALADMAPPN